jgi:hypothetical protein
MVALRPPEIVAVPMERAVGRSNLVPRESDIVTTVKERSSSGAVGTCVSGCTTCQPEDFLNVRRLGIHVGLAILSEARGQSALQVGELACRLAMFT